VVVSTTRRPRRATSEQMRALVHPLRSRIMEALINDGPSTASKLAAQLGESSGATSYHLRVLAEAGVIEEVPDRGNGRDRWWRRTEQFYLPTDAEEPEGRAVELAARLMHIERDEEALRRFLASHDSLSAELRGAAFTGSFTAYMTPEELLDFGLEFMTRVDEVRLRKERPPGARKVVLSLHALPWLSEEE
jgi:DNA-binding transcriptional ArsR family regulator